MSKKLKARRERQQIQAEAQRSCRSKIAYTTEDEAQMAIMRTLNNKRSELRVYRCPYRSEFHIGHYSNSQY